MDSRTNGYKWATWILLIIVIILAVMLTRKGNETVMGTFEGLNQAIADCRADIASWQQRYPSGATGTTTATTSDAAEEAQEELEDIIESCMETVEDAQATIGGDDAMMER